MNVRSAKQTAAAWVAENRDRWPGLCAAHLVGGITAMPDDAPFPTTKDVDVHLIFANDSPALRPEGPFPPIIEESFRGLPIEAGIKPESEYASAEAILANPEIAYHLTVDSLLHDPDGWLRGLQDGVRREYPRRRWVCARLDHERRGLAGALELRAFAAEAYGASGEAAILGYPFTFLTAALFVADLRPPKMGGRMFAHSRAFLAEHGRLDLHDATLEVLGVRHAARERVEALLVEAAAAFDRAVVVRRTPHPFQHKLHAHLRAYFVDCCRGLIADGFHREALAWITPYFCASTGVILADGDAAEQPGFAVRQDGLLRELGMDTPGARAEKAARLDRLAEQCFAFADEIVAVHPGIVD